MPDIYQSFNCFISSPGDVSNEGRIAEDTITGINRTCLETLKFSLNVKRWQHLPPTTPHLPEEKLQDLLNKEVEKSHFFVLILYKRYGTVEPGQTVSNTERELDTILARYKKNPQLKILAYFRRLQDNEDRGQQEQKVRDFRDRLQQMGMFCKTYNDPTEFRDQLTHDLYEIILRMQLSSFKQEALRNYWVFGGLDRPTRPRLAILYPPVNRRHSGLNHDKAFWHKRLEPNIYFEDHKAIEKLRKVLGLVGFRDYQVFSSLNAPSDLQYMNRLWICMPRCARGIAQLETYGDQTCFHFTKRVANRHATILWKRDGVELRVNSPTAKYMKLQRRRMDVSGEWHPQLAKIIAKDYAVLARLSQKHVVDPTEGPLRDYFIAGVRGLGTWGAAWLLDRRYKLLTTHEKEEDIQLLLEVEYRDGTIVDVRDVSDQPQSYFDDQNSLPVIRSAIRSFRS